VTRLAFDEVRTLDELSLVREPERRLHRELVAAGLRVLLREDRQSGQSAYDIAGLRLRFDVSDANGQNVRCDCYELLAADALIYWPRNKMNHQNARV
jgi:hypothetical protein